MNTQVQAKAKELAQAIASSHEYIAMRLAEEDMEEDAQLQERFIDYNEKKQALEDLMTQDSPDQEAVRRASEAFEEAQKTKRVPTIAAHLAVEPLGNHDGAAKGLRGGAGLLRRDERLEDTSH